MTRWLPLALTVLMAACGGSVAIDECDPCLGAIGPRSRTAVDGSNVVCSCAVGSGQQTYALVLETTTACTESRAAWATYSTAHCH